MDEQTLAYSLEQTKKTVAIDFDGVLHPYTAGWQGPEPTDEPPTLDTTRALMGLNREWRIVVFSTRAAHPDGRKGIEAWLQKWGLAEFVDEVTEKKPAAFAYIDDRAIRFQNNWGEVVKVVRELANGHILGPGRVTTGEVIKWAGIGTEPTRAYPGDAGFDLYSRETLWISAGEWVKVHTGVAVQLPPGVWAMLLGRSSSWVRGLLVNQTVIDTGFRGELFAMVRNVNQEEGTRINKGERIAQLVPMGNLAETLQMQQVEELETSERGEKGLGSSGR